jgi:integrase
MTSLTPEQAGSFLVALKGTTYEALFTVWIHTGLRPAEIAALKWDDFDGASLAVRRAFVRVEKTKRVIGPTKTGKPRLIPLGTDVVRVLKEQRRAQVEHRLAVGELYQD